MIKTRVMIAVPCSTATMIIAAKFDFWPKLINRQREKPTVSGECCFSLNFNLFINQWMNECSAMRKFRDMDKRALVENTVSNTMLDTVHQNTILEVRLYSDFDSKLRKTEQISTIGVDGKMVIWDLKVRLDQANTTNTHWILMLYISFSRLNLRWPTWKSNECSMRCCVSISLIIASIYYLLDHWISCMYTNTHRD